MKKWIINSCFSATIKLDLVVGPPLARLGFKSFSAKLLFKGFLIAPARWFVRALAAAETHLDTRLNILLKPNTKSFKNSRADRDFLIFPQLFCGGVVLL